MNNKTLTLSIRSDSISDELKSLIINGLENDNSILIPININKNNYVGFFMSCDKIRAELGETVLNSIKKKMSYLEIIHDNGDDIIRWPCKICDAIDKLFSHNSRIQLWNNTIEDDRPIYKLLWKGMAWNIPDVLRDLKILKFEDIMPDKITDADCINLIVDNYDGEYDDQMSEHEKELFKQRLSGCHEYCE